MRETLTHERAWQLLHYEPQTGWFTWKTREQELPASASKFVGKRAGSIHQSGYRIIVLDGRHYRAGRLAWFMMTGSWPQSLVDHKDCDRSNDAWSNLRQATSSENCANTRIRSDNTSGFKGVVWVKPRSKWTAFITVGGRIKRLGYFNDKYAAADAYAVAAKDLFGEFARPGLAAAAALDEARKALGK